MERVPLKGDEVSIIGYVSNLDWVTTCQGLFKHFPTGWDWDG